MPAFEFCAHNEHFYIFIKEDQTKSKMESREGRWRREGKGRERREIRTLNIKSCSISSRNCSKMMSYLHTSKYKPIQ